MNVVGGGEHALLDQTYTSVLTDFLSMPGFPLVPVREFPNAARSNLDRVQ